MSFVGGLLGIGGGGNGGSGLNYNAEKAAILNPATLDQANQAYAQTQTGLDQQQAFLNALQAQNGIGNQANVFQQQQALANQFQGLANGVGPNPALQQLQNTTGQNIQNQAALMASQRGVGANAGLLARQAAQQGSSIQQQAAGQAAALSAQQQLAGLQGLQQQQGMLGNLATQQVAQQGNALTGYNQATQSEQQNLLNSIAQANNANVSAQNNVNSVQGNLANTAAQGQQGLLGGALGGVGPAASWLLKGTGGLGAAGAGGGAAGASAGGAGGVDALLSGAALAANKGGMIPHYAGGGGVPFNLGIPAMETPDLNGPQSMAGRYLFSSAPSQQSAENPAPFESMGTANTGASALQKGTTSALSSLFSLKDGGSVPGKAAVKGDSLKNDQVPALLSPGEVVIPRHVMQSADPVSNAARFVQAVLAKKGKGGSTK